MQERGLKLDAYESNLGASQSLPMRERGLKLPPGHDILHHRESLPMRERGLKLVLHIKGCQLLWPFPLRERGLKHRRGIDATLVHSLYPHGRLRLNPILGPYNALWKRVFHYTI